MQVILLDKIRNLGNLGDRVNVKAGYGRNYLVPQGKAVFASQENVAMFEQKRAELEKRAQEKLAQAEIRAEKINAASVVIEAMASEEGKLYGSVGPAEICDAMLAKDLDVTKREINMAEGPIHAVGEYQVDVLLHSDVIASIKVEITASA